MSAKPATQVAKPSSKTPGPSQGSEIKQVSLEQRRQMIAEAAYYHALNRGFLGGSPEEDWCVAEAEIDALLMGTKPH